MKSAMPPSRVAAFMATAPPTVAGTPTRHSMPPRLSAAASRMSADRLTPAPPAVANQEVVAPADDVERELLPPRERQREPDVLHVLRDDEDVRGASDAQGGVKAEGFLEPNLASDLSQHAYLLLDVVPGSGPRRLSSSPPSCPTSPAPRVSTRSPALVDSHR